MKTDRNIENCVVTNWIIINCRDENILNKIQNKFGHVEKISYLCSIKKNKEKQHFKTEAGQDNGPQN